MKTALCSVMIAATMMAALVGADAHAKPAAKTAKTANATSPQSGPKPWATAGWVERYMAKRNSREGQTKLTLVTGGKASLIFAGQKDPQKNLWTTSLGPSFLEEGERGIDGVSSTGQDVSGQCAKDDGPSCFRARRGWLEAKPSKMERYRESYTKGFAEGGSSRYAEVMDASTIKPGCVGMINRAYMQAIWVEAGVPDLRIFASAGKVTEDLSLVVATPSGELICNDDAVGRDPLIEISKPAPGMYSVWVGKGDPDVSMTLDASIDRNAKFEVESQRLKELAAARADAADNGGGGGGGGGDRNKAFQVCSARARAKGNGNNSGASKTLASCMKEHGF